MRRFKGLWPIFAFAGTILSLLIVFQFDIKTVGRAGGRLSDLAHDDELLLVENRRESTERMPPTAREGGLLSRASASARLERFHAPVFRVQLQRLNLRGERYPGGFDGTQGMTRRETEEFVEEVSAGTLNRINSNDPPGEYRLATVINKQSGAIGVVGTMEIGDETFSIQGQLDADGRGLTIQRFDRRVVRTPPCETSDSDSVVKSGDGLPGGLVAGGEANAQQVSVIKLLAAYTQGVYKLLGNSVEQVKAMVAYKISEGNAAFENSALQIKLELACEPYLLQPGVPESAAATNFGTQRGDGIADELHELRKECEADITHIFQVGKNAAGNIPKMPFPENPEIVYGRSAFSSSVVGNAYYLGFTTVFPHEIGHNFGAGHDVLAAPPDTDPNDLGFYPDSHGHRFTGLDGKKFATIETYTEPGETRIHHYSNPQIMYQGVPTGDQTANNVKAMKFMAPIIAQYGENISYPDDVNVVAVLVRKPDDPVLYVLATLEGNLQNPLLQREEIVISTTLQSGQISDVKKGEAAKGSLESAPPLYLKFVYASLLPDRYRKSQDLPLPDLNNSEIALAAGENGISGKVTIGGQPVGPIAGDWIGIYYRPNKNSAQINVGYVGLGAGGNFSVPAYTEGFYQARFPASAGTKESPEVAYVPPPGTMPPTATPTATSTPTSIPATATVALPATSVPTSTPAPISVPTLTPTSTPTVAPLNTATPLPNESFSITLLDRNAKSKGPKAQLTGKVTTQQSKKPVSGLTVTIECNNGKVKRTATTNSNGVFKATISRPAARNGSCVAQTPDGTTSAKIVIVPQL